MIVELLPVAYADKALLQNMIQLYCYELSANEDLSLNEHGLYGYRWLDNYWTEESRLPFLVTVDDELAGFVLVRAQLKDCDYYIAEFFIMHKFHRRGVGRTIAHRIFSELPGQWALTTSDLNERAKQFWPKIIRAVSDDLEIQAADGGVSKRWVYRFTVKR